MTGRYRRLVRIVLAGGLLFGCGLFYRYFWLTHPIGNGPAGRAVDRSLFEKPWTNRPVMLLGLGDSVTDGFGASGGKSYFDRLVKNSADEFADMSGINLRAVIPNLDVLNIAMSASTSQELVEYQLPRLPDVDDATFGIVVMTTGGNDIIDNYGQTPPHEGAMYGATFEQAAPWIANFETRLNKILDKVTSHFTAGCSIFLANIYDPTDGIGDTMNAGLPRWPDGLKIHAAYNQVITDATKRRGNVFLIDMRGEFLGHGIHSRQFWQPFYRSDDPGYWYFDNLEDPNDRGYDALRRLFLDAMSRTLPTAFDRLFDPHSNDPYSNTVSHDEKRPERERLGQSGKHEASLTLESETCGTSD
ncbi:MAG: SGNH/GDSL hydrolase family protein [Rhodopirellula sp.]|nr:SGNH/GDSL hydrolase family protein [Rhodopirellula sp.]